MKFLLGTALALGTTVVAVISDVKSPQTAASSGVTSGADYGAIPTDGQDDTQTAPYANRTLDPAVLSHTTASHNLSLASSVAGFEKLWKEMAIAQNSTQPDPDDPYQPHNMPH